ncbi:MAG: DNA polymerase III subunit alpha [Candidatus Aminicenantes bacterium]|nr:DNA polymerase III subunit alpha [Candidatus Aminicenantes bacterium]
MKYIPLRVYSTYSRGRGAVEPDKLAEFLGAEKISSLALCDPFSLTGWEYFRGAALSRKMKPLLGMEIRLKGPGSLLLFPAAAGGFFSLVSSYNRKVFSKMADVVMVFIPGKGRFFREADLTGLKEQVPAEHLYLGLEWDSSRGVVDMAGRFDIPIVWAQPLRWVKNPEKYGVVSAIFNHRSISENLHRIDTNRDSHLFGPISDSAIIKRWGDIGREAMRNTFALSSKINFDFSDMFSSAFCRLSGKGSPLPGEKLEAEINREIRKRDLNTAERDRTFRELKIIKDLGFSSYFLIAAEIASFCKKSRIYFNLRGSGVSSFILFLLGLSKVNPLRFNLLFERFVNSLRNDLPDIDIDFDSSRRPEVLAWVFGRHKNRVAFVSTHKFFRARSALYETLRCHGFNPEESHKFSKELPMFASPSELRGKGRGRMAEIYNRAALLEGVYKELSLHVGGVVFSADEIGKSFPLEKSPQGFPQMVWDKDSIERLRIFKLDLLGVRGFDVISPAALERRFDFHDREVWKNIRQGKTIGCFQLESPLARENLQKVLPENLGDLAISVAIIRPGPARSGMKKAYIERREPLHPVLKQIFPHTRGAVIFEEQITLLLHRVTGWNLEFSEVVRKSLKKKRGDQHREDFFLRGGKNGWQSKDLEKFWKIASDFSLYAFNQAHSLSYGFSAYISAWFRTRHPLSFFCRLFNSGGGYYPLLFYIEEAGKNGIRLLPPDVNHSHIGFSREKGALRTGLYFIKGIGRKLAEKILQERGSGYRNIEDFTARTKLGERDLSSLMAVSAFQSLGYDGFSPQEREENWKKYLGFVP